MSQLNAAWIKHMQDFFRVQYNNNPDQAHLDVAQAMYYLNRYVKRPSCGRDNQRDIYELKNQLTQIFYKQGFCRRCSHQYDHKPSWNCHDGDDDWCHKCGGTGIYRIHHYALFHFRIENEDFLWHQRLDKLAFVPDYDEGDETFRPAPIKPITAPRLYLAQAAKDLVRWYGYYSYSKDLVRWYVHYFN